MNKSFARKGFAAVALIAILALAACQPGNGLGTVTVEPGALATDAGVPVTGSTADPMATAALPTTAATDDSSMSSTQSAGGEMEDNPKIEVEAQALSNGSVIIEKVETGVAGWVVIHADNGGKPGEVLGYAAAPVGETEDLSIQVDAAKVTPQLYAMLHVDAGEVGVYEFPGADAPAMGKDGGMVNVPFQVEGGAAAGSTSQASTMEGVELKVAESAELGPYLTDGEGMTLYLFTKDEPNVSNCSGGCLEAWPPLLVSSLEDVKAGEGVDQAKIGAIPFEGGQMLVTYDSMPLYYWVEDTQPGDTTGQNVNGVWFVVAP